MKTSDLKNVILQVIKDEQLHGYEVRKKLAAQGIDIDYGRLYKVINQMMDDGTLDCHWENSTIGPKRKLCKIGEKGKKDIEKNSSNAIETIHKVYGEYLTNLPPNSNVFNRIAKSSTDGLKPTAAIAFISLNLSPMHIRLLQFLRNGKSDLTIYFISPKSRDSNLHNENIIHLEGTYKDIPLKDKKIDLLIMDMPDIRTIEKSVEEWHRVTTKECKIVLISPTVLLHEKQDPMSIGDYIEHLEHIIIKKQEVTDSKLVLNLLRKHFLKVEEEQIVHMTTIIANGQKIPN